MTDEHDDDPTQPDLPSGLGSGDEPTHPGVGTGEAFIAITAGADRYVAALRGLANECPPPGAASRRRHLEVYAHAWGELGMMCFDARRITLELLLEEEESK